MTLISLQEYVFNQKHQQKRCCTHGIKLRQFSRKASIAIRKHTDVEDNLHWGLDMFFGENQCRRWQGYTDKNGSRLEANSPSCATERDIIQNRHRRQVVQDQHDRLKVRYTSMQTPCFGHANNKTITNTTVICDKPNVSWD